jgi:glycosyltransferase involved in cell wall biosynthesis
MKTMRAIWAMVRIPIARLAGARLLYASVDDRFGMIWNCAFAALARILAMKLVLHHHSFRYVDSRKALMRALTCIAGRSALHIILCRTMGARFQALYPPVGNVASVPNCVPLPEGARAQPSPAAGGQITLGLLANLTFEKGLGEFTELLSEALDEQLPVGGILAGPAADRPALLHVQDALRKLGPSLDWRGPVAGDSKEKFFADIDVFVFASSYPSEAYPLVLLEALGRGKPVITIARGCIGDLARLSSCTVLPANSGFVASALEQLRIWTADPKALADAGCAAFREGRELNAANRDAREALADMITAQAREPRTQVA